MQANDLVKFSKILEPGDETLVFKVLELMGDRVLVEAQVNLPIRPTYIYPVGDLKVIEQ